MRWIGLGASALATLVTVVASCNLLVGVQDYCFDKCATGGGPDNDGGDLDAGDAGDAAEAGMPSPVLFAKGYGDPGEQTVNAVAVAPSGDIFITGKTSSAYDFGCPKDADAGSTGDHSGYLVELDPMDGSCVWGYFFGDGAEGVSVVPFNSHVLLAGTFQTHLELPGAGPITAMPSAQASFVMRFDPMHAVKWVTMFYGGGAPTKVTSIAADPLVDASSVVVAVNYNDTLTSANGAGTETPITPTTAGQHAWALVLDATSGAPDMSKSISVGSATPNPQTLSQVQIISGGVAFTGQATGGAVINGVTVNAPAISSALAASLMGNMTLLEGIVPGDNTQSGSALVPDPNGGAFVAGDFLGHLGSADAGAHLDNSGNQHVFVAHVSGTVSAFHVDSVVELGATDATGIASAKGMAMDKNGLVLAGLFSHSLQLDSMDQHTAAGINDIFVAKVDTKLAPVRLLTFGASGKDQGADAIAIDANGDAIVAGHYKGDIDFSKKLQLKNKGGSDVFVIRIAPN